LKQNLLIETQLSNWNPVLTSQFFQPDVAPPEWNLDVAQAISAGLDPEVGCVIVSFDHHLVSINDGFN
jgi:hypothetical protein